jgi:periplasmic protein TonB
VNWDENAQGMNNSGATRFSQSRRPLSLPLLIAVAMLHVAVLYGLAHALAPDFTASVERGVVAAFTLEAPPPEPPAVREPDLADEGAAGDPGREAVPREVVAPPPVVIVQHAPAPRAASTGTANRSGAAETGEGTGAAGSGDGTGSGQAGSGQGGGILATRPVHISGEINNARDYPVPPGGRQSRSGTEVIVRVIVGVDGRARNCSIYRPSPDPEADSLTCQLVEQRLGFRPATDAQGKAVAAPFYWRQRWF